jgi:hypothetical protein
MQAVFGTSPLPVRECRGILSCILTLLSDNKLIVKCRKSLLSQLTLESVHHLSNCENDEINQLLNAIVLELNEDLPLTAFHAFLRVAGKYETGTEKRTRLALKLIEASGMRIYELNITDDVNGALSAIGGFFEKHPKEELGKTGIAKKVLETLKRLHSTLSEKARETDPVQIRAPCKPSSRRIVTPDVPRKAAVRGLRPPRA